MTHIGDALEPREDVLDSGPPARPAKWVALAAAVVVVLVGWSVFRPGGDEPALPAAESHAADTSTGWVAETRPALPGRPDRVDQLTFVDAEHGFLVQDVCSQSYGPCQRRVLATDDGGQTWEARAVTPAFAAGYYPLVAQSEFDLALIDHVTLTRLARSYDGGRSWSERPITRAKPAPAPVGARLVQDVEPMGCSGCPSTLAWIDPLAQELHPLPSQPGAGPTAFPGPASMGPDGDVVTVTFADSAGLFSMSTDGGQTWADAQLAIPLEQGQAIEQVQGWSAGGGRGYAFLQVFDGLGIVTSYGFRTDDGGNTWTSLHFEDQQIGIPVGVLDGELLSTELPGRVLMSDAGGTRWSEVGSVGNRPYLSQAVPDGPLLATQLNSQGFESYYVSPDGRDWTFVRLPAL
ncbi:MAG: hypothetical protein ACR2JK_13080 [Geodermatophilaceae bacterium]